MQLFDTHLHLDKTNTTGNPFAAARESGVTRFLLCGGCLSGSQRALETAKHEDGVYAAAGVHPHDAEDYANLDLAPFLPLYAEERVVAVGEIGLDYHYDNSPREIQRNVFRKFMQIAGELDLPAVIHCREAMDDCLAILDEVLLPGQRFEIHSFTGTPKEAEKALERGAMISYNGIVTFSAAKNVRETLCVVPVERLLLETDSPWLAPVPHRGKTNQPAYIVHVAEKVAEVKGIPVEELADITTSNACNFFKIRE